MIISRITMGLGNQMFQYAAGKCLSLEKNVPFKVDVASYEGYKLRKYELDVFFAINTAKVSKEELKEFGVRNSVKRVWNKLSRKKLRMLGLGYEERSIPRHILSIYNLFSPPEKRNVYEEPHFHFHKSFFKASKHTYLNGYWMSWKYFEKYEEEIRNEFKIRQNIVEHLDNVASKIKATNSVSIHIRRGDFTSQKNSKLHGVIGIEFYRKAIQLLCKKIGKIELFIFSDEIGWAKENLKVNVPAIFISDEITKTAIEDFYLMTVCKHNIIANSTFSWWAAWLNKNSNKIVIAPGKWYNKSIFNYNDVYPPSWIILQ